MASSEWRIVNGAAAPVLFAIRHSLFALAALLFAAQSHAQVETAKIAARPALWTVHSRSTILYLLGSIHLLPDNVIWHTPQIDRALASSDTFVFEAPLDDAGKAQIAEFIREHGALPKGASLRALLPAKTLHDYERSLTLAHLSPELLDGERPWLAAIVIEVSYLQQLHYVIADGVDQKIYAFAREQGKQVRMLETPAQQLSYFLPDDKKLEIKEFDAELNSFQSELSKTGEMIDAWGSGDAKSVGRLMNEALGKEPDAKKRLIDDRNRNWIKPLDELLSEPRTVFVTVGTGHLVGPQGVPALLRAQGYRVDGP